MILNDEVLANSILKHAIRYCTIMVKTKGNQYLYVFCFVRWLLKKCNSGYQGAQNPSMNIRFILVYNRDRISGNISIS